MKTLLFLTFLFVLLCAIIGGAKCMHAELKANLPHAVGRK